jgi:hypothetical protein
MGEPMVFLNITLLHPPIKNIFLFKKWLKIYAYGK